MIRFAQWDVIPRWAGGFLFLLMPKNKALHWAASKWFSEPWQWQYQLCPNEPF
jgi:hypothetical protein